MSSVNEPDTIIVHWTLRKQADELLPRGWYWSIRSGTSKERPVLFAVIDEIGREIASVVATEKTNDNFEYMLKLAEAYLREHE